MFNKRNIMRKATRIRYDFWHQLQMRKCFVDYFMICMAYNLCEKKNN